MRLVRHPDAAAFAAVALPYLAVDPARHTITLTMLDGLLRSGAPPALAMTLHEDDVLVGAVLRPADRGILVSGLPPRYAGVVAAALAGTQLPGAVGPVAEAEAFAEAWTAPVQHRFDQRLFELGTLTPPVGVPGAARPATAADAALLGAWRAAFTAETGVGQSGSRPPPEVAVGQSGSRPPPEVAVGQSGSRPPPEVAVGQTGSHPPPEVAVGPGEWLWQVDGVPVAQASARPVIAGMSRIGPVYTPPEHRRHGYGAAVTAAASRWALDVGARLVVLFTDAGNPSTNALYPRLGYRYRHDAVMLEFACPG
jgi:GNAT superfamily N-acetyltransferase